MGGIAPGKCRFQDTRVNAGAVGPGIDLAANAGVDQDDRAIFL
jgi:hypothetical protein